MPSYIAPITNTTQPCGSPDTDSLKLGSLYGADHALVVGLHVTVYQEVELLLLRPVPDQRLDALDVIHLGEFLKYEDLSVSKSTKDS